MCGGAGIPLQSAAWRGITPKETTCSVHFCRSANIYIIRISLLISIRILVPHDQYKGEKRQADKMFHLPPQRRRSLGDA